MRKLLLIMLAVVWMYGCDEGNKTVTCEDTFKGQHKLMCITPDSTGADCQYMVVFGDKARYMWQTNDTSFAMSVISVGKIRVKLDESVDEPYIKYRWCSCRGSGDLQATIDAYVVYVLLVCSEEDCPKQLIGAEPKEKDEED